MLSLRSGKKIAIIDGDKKDLVFLKNDNDDEAEIDTTAANKRHVFKSFIEMDKKLSDDDTGMLLSSFEKGVEPSNSKLVRKYKDGQKFVTNSLKKHLDYGSKHSLFPIIDEPSYRLFISGLSGSGKSFFIAMFLKYNRPKTKGAGIFLFSPVKNDKALSTVKNLIHIDLDEFAEEFKGKQFELEDVPEGSVVIFDDIESYKKHDAKRYMELRDMFLERGRHSDISTICVSHNACNGHSTKASIREAQYWVLFPSANIRDSKNILKTYGGLETDKINELMSLKTRWLFFKKTIEQYAVSEHSIVVI